MTTHEPKAGRELDAVLYEKFLGLRVHWRPTPTSPNEPHYVTRRPQLDGGAIDEPTWCLPLSTDLASAWTLVAEAANRGWKVDVQNRYGGCWGVHINFPAHVSYERVFVTAVDRFDTLVPGPGTPINNQPVANRMAALAICRAIYRAVHVLAPDPAPGVPSI